MASFPSGLASFAGFNPNDTLAADSHAAQHNSEQAEIVAIETKLGTGNSSPTTGTVLRGTGTGTTAFDTLHLGTDVQGILSTANGGNGTNSTTGTGSVVFGTSPTISNANLTSQPTITDFTNANHTHTSTSWAGLLGSNTVGSSQLQTGSVTYNKIGTDSSYACQPFTPSWTNLVVGTGGSANNTGFLIQIGKIVYWYVTTVLGSSGASVSSAPYFTFPLNINTSHYLAGAINFIGQVNASVGGANSPGFWQFNTSIATNAVQPTYMPTSTTLAGYNTTVPATWAAGNGIIGGGTVEVS